MCGYLRVSSGSVRQTMVGLSQTVISSFSLATCSETFDMIYIGYTGYIASRVSDPQLVLHDLE